MKTIIVHNIITTDADELSQLFSQYGGVAGVTMLPEQRSACVVMASEDGAAEAMKALQGAPFHEFRLWLQWEIGFSGIVPGRPGD
jgi:RNA recognition motif-containing protein